MVLPAREAGLYTYDVSLRRQGERELAYADTMRIGPDRTEYAVAGQNTTLLEQLARPVECRTPADMAALLTASSGAQARRTVTANLRVEHTWLLLAALAGLFVLEWVVRRVWMLD